MPDTIIEIRDATMDFLVDRGGSRTLKELLINFVKGNVHYDRFRAVDHVNVDIKRGEVYGIIGRNGAGKSTLLKMIAGVLTPTSGSISIHGNIAPMLELGAGFDHDLTARENVYLNGSILGYSKEFLDARFDEIIKFAELESFVDQPIRTFSSGMMMRLAFSIATQVDPEILIVDEIMSVGDSHFRQKSERRMQELMSGGTTVLMVSHVLPQIRSMCDKVIWLDHGKVVMAGETQYVCDAYEGLIDFDNAPQFEIGRKMEDIQRVTMYRDNWLPPQGSYKIKTGPMGLISGNLRCPFHNELSGKEKIKIYLDCNEDAEPLTIDVKDEFMSFELLGTPDTVVTVHIDSNFHRSPNGEQRKLCVVLEDTDGN